MFQSVNDAEEIFSEMTPQTSSKSIYLLKLGLANNQELCAPVQKKHLALQIRMKDRRRRTVCEDEVDMEISPT